MIFTEEMLQSMKKVEAAREANIAYEPRRMTAEEKENLLAQYHPDYKDAGFTTIKTGGNKGQKAPVELVEVLEGRSRVLDLNVDLNKIDYDVDVLVIGGGGAGSSAAIEAHEAGANVMIVTKLRIGDANTMMAEGGIQAADKPGDSPAHQTVQEEVILVVLSSADVAVHSSVNSKTHSSDSFPAVSWSCAV